MKQAASQFVIWYLRAWARLAITLSNPTIIGITGSVGKSSTRNALACVFPGIGRTKVVAEGNSETGIPLGILGLNISSYSSFEWILLLLKAPFGIFHIRGCRFLIVEMAIDHPDYPKNMDYLLTIVKPYISVFLNVSAVHTEPFLRKYGEHTSSERIIKYIAAEKAKIITQNHNCKVGIYNADNRYIVEALKGVSTTKLLSFGETKGDIRLMKYEVSTEGTRFIFEMEEHKDVTITIHNQLLPRAYKDVFAATLLVVSAIGESVEEAANRISSEYRLPESRGSIFGGINKSLIIDSSYNASKESVLAYLDMLSELKKQTNRNTIFVFGDMRELGALSKSEHEDVAKKIMDTVDECYLTGPMTQKYVLPILEKKIKHVQWFRNAIEIGEHLKKNITDKSIVLVKGSQNDLYLEEVVKILLTNPENVKYICRQNEYWQKKKLSFFSSH